MSAQQTYQVRTIQANTGKKKNINLQRPFKMYTVDEFRREVANYEHVAMSSIQLVDYDKEKYVHGMGVDTETKMDGLYTNNVIKY